MVPVAYEMGALKEERSRTQPGTGAGRGPLRRLQHLARRGLSLSGPLGAMDRSPKLRVICTGGEIRGHHEEGFQRFRQRAEQAPTVLASPSTAGCRIVDWRSF